MALRSPSDPDVAGNWCETLRWLVLCRAQLSEQLDRIARRWGLTADDILALHECGKHRWNGINQRELAARIGVSTAKLSGQLEKLRGRGLASPRRNGGDRRQQLWQVTERAVVLLCSLCDELSTMLGAPNQVESSTLQKIGRQLRVGGASSPRTGDEVAA